MPTRNVNLTDHFDRFVQSRIRSGRFSNASEVVREGLRLLEQRDSEDRARIEALRSASSQGFAELDRGEGVTFETGREFSAFVDRLQGQAGAATAPRRISRKRA